MTIEERSLKLAADLLAESSNYFGEPVGGKQKQEWADRIAALVREEVTEGCRETCDRCIELLKDCGSPYYLEMLHGEEWEHRTRLAHAISKLETGK